MVAFIGRVSSTGRLVEITRDIFFIPETERCSNSKFNTRERNASYGKKTLKNVPTYKRIFRFSYIFVFNSTVIKKRVNEFSNTYKSVGVLNNN